MTQPASEYDTIMLLTLAALFWYMFYDLQLQSNMRDTGCQNGNIAGNTACHSVYVAVTD